MGPEQAFVNRSTGRLKAFCVMRHEKLGSAWKLYLQSEDDEATGADRNM